MRIILIMLGLAIGCSSIKPGSESLDIQTLPKLPPSASNNDEAKLQASKEGEKQLDNLISNWREFFHETPIPRERVLLEAKVGEWKKSSDVSIQLKRAWGLIALGQDSAADRTLRNIITIAPGNLDALLTMASLAQRRNKNNSALSLLREIKKQIQEGEPVEQNFLTSYRYTLALTHLQMNRLEQGRYVLRDLIKQDRSFTPGYLALASSYLRNGRAQLAEFIVRRGLENNAENAALINFQGLLHEHRKDYPNALAAYTKALELRPNFSQAMVNVARSKIRTDEYDLANSMLHRAIKADPQNSVAYMTLGILRNKQGKFKKAKIAFEEALKLAPNNAENRFNLAILLLNEFNQREQAARMLTKSPKSPQRILTSNLASNYVDELKNLEKLKFITK